MVHFWELYQRIKYLWFDAFSFSTVSGIIYSEDVGGKVQVAGLQYVDT